MELGVFIFLAALLSFGMRVLLEGEAKYGGRWGKLEVELKVGSPTSAAALISELTRSRLISGESIFLLANIGPRCGGNFCWHVSAGREVRSVVQCLEQKGGRERGRERPEEFTGFFWSRVQLCNRWITLLLGFTEDMPCRLHHLCVQVQVQREFEPSRLC